MASAILSNRQENQPYIGTCSEFNGKRPPKGASQVCISLIQSACLQLIFLGDSIMNVTHDRKDAVRPESEKHERLAWQQPQWRALDAKDAEASFTNPSSDGGFNHS